jgi:hypothetical protein
MSVESNGRAQVERLIAYEASRAGGADATLMVCQKLYLEVGQFIGAEGFRVLFARALHLDRPDHALLADVRIGDPASGECLTGLAEIGEDPEVIHAAAAAVIGGFLDLLSTFIGDDLTQRMIHRRWPDVALLRSRDVDKRKHNG